GGKTGGGVESRKVLDGLKRYLIWVRVEEVKERGKGVVFVGEDVEVDEERIGWILGERGVVGEGRFDKRRG
ncbi:hypothetical protein, partial [Bacillus sp. WP8]|uniref:hypothetical protein n=1 Tax=Bacillus sp. WP8 TaxID=756828 RepID=UPI001642FB2F